MDDIEIKSIENSFQQVINLFNSEIPLCEIHNVQQSSKGTFH